MDMNNNTKLLKQPAVGRRVLMKYINMTREEEIKFMSECINGKPRYSDSEIALSLAMMSVSGK
jgi:hypothetical protein